MYDDFTHYDKLSHIAEQVMRVSQPIDRLNEQVLKATQPLHEQIAKAMRPSAAMQTMIDKIAQEQERFAALTSPRLQYALEGQIKLQEQYAPLIEKFSAAESRNRELLEGAFGKIDHEKLFPKLGLDDSVAKLMKDIKLSPYQEAIDSLTRIEKLYAPTISAATIAAQGAAAQLSKQIEQLGLGQNDIFAKLARSQNIFEEMYSAFGSEEWRDFASKLEENDDEIVQSFIETLFEYTFFNTYLLLATKFSGKALVWTANNAIIFNLDTLRL